VDRPGRNLALLAALAVVVAGVGVLLLTESAHEAAQPRPPETPRRGAVLDVRASAVAISPDGRRCVTLDRAGDASLWSCADGERLLRRRAGASGGRPTVSYTRDGLAILATTGGGARVLDPGDLAVVRKLRGPSSELAPAISPSGARALRPLSAHRAAITDTARGRRVAVLPHIPDLGRATVVFSGDDRAVAVITRPRSWATVFDATNGVPINSFALEDTRAHVDLSADGTRLLIADGTTVRIVDVLTGIERERFAARGRVSTGSFGVNERFVVTGGADGTVNVWDTATGAEVAEYAGGPGAVESAALAADGRLLVAGRGGLPVVLDCGPCARG
jgi:WD40 repeat protein